MKGCLGDGERDGCMYCLLVVRGMEGWVVDGRREE